LSQTARRGAGERNRLRRRGRLAPARTVLEQRLGLLADIAFYLVALYFFFYLSRYYVTGAGGPSLLAVNAVPLTVCLVVLNDLRKGDLYPRLGVIAPHLIALAYVAFSFYAIWYLVSEFDNIRIYRIAVWNMHDMIVGGGMTALVLEYTRRRYFSLFVINVALILYTVYGYVIPGMFHHPGMSWTRVVTSTSLEMSTGIFERLSQLA
jgi:TRAP-type uncharacterized transport system fused permease subunit